MKTLFDAVRSVVGMKLIGITLSVLPKPEALVFASALANSRFFDKARTIINMRAPSRPGAQSGR